MKKKEHSHDEDIYRISYISENKHCLKNKQEVPGSSPAITKPKKKTKFYKYRKEIYIAMEVSFNEKSIHVFHT